MSFKFMAMNARGDCEQESELNAFLASHRVLAVDRRFVDCGAYSYWALCIDYLESSSAHAPRAQRAGMRRERIDYQQVLSADDFAVFSQLRDLRKAISQSDAVPVYTIFTNEQLAEMVRRRAISKASLEEIVGVGDMRVEKYGERILALLSKNFVAPNEKIPGNTS